MAPAVARADRAPSIKPVEAPKQNVALLGEADRGLREMARELHRKIVAATVDVGERNSRARPGASTTARRRERPIRGQTSAEEARALLDEGVAIMPMPATPEDLG